MTHALIPDYKSLFNNSPCGLLTLRQGKISNVNSTLLQWLDLDETDILGKNISDLLDKGGKVYYQLFVQPILKMHGTVKEIDLTIRSNNASFPCLFTAQSGPKSDDEELFYCAFYKVADRKKYESELLKKKVQAEEEKKDKVQVLNDIAFDQAHLARAPLANMLALISLVKTMDISEDVLGIVEMLQTSTEQLDVRIKEIVRKTGA
ncbi:PAS domain-containing protein [Desertivirga brevis]|uniref:PAS domain-containing protein n=1 Tax=Desertivirga brevis TaxID=2810310 RepID=UPI001A97A73D|nr:PAS domain-containing protein [Pedobacter sp. SYSU D00873]